MTAHLAPGYLQRSFPGSEHARIIEDLYINLLDLHQLICSRSFLLAALEAGTATARGIISSRL